MTQTELTAEESTRPPATWESLRARLLTRVFYAFPPDAVSASTDLVSDGYLDSMSILVVLGMFDEELGDGVAMRHARIPDTTSLDAMRRLYERLRTDRLSEA